MATYITPEGLRKEINRAFIIKVRRHIVEDMERKLYNALSPAYRKKFTMQKWVREQSVGRLFMTGDKDNCIFSEFFSIFYPQAMEQSLLILHDEDESHNVVIDMFEMFRTRRKYVRNKEVADIQKKIREIERLIENREQKVTMSDFKATKSFSKELAEIEEFKAEISTLEARIKELETKDAEAYARRLESYDGLTYDEIYDRESRDFSKSEDNEWFSDDKPISGYIAVSAKNLSLMRFNRMQTNIVIPMSKLTSNTDTDDEEMIDIAHKRNTVKEDDEEIEIVSAEDIFNPDEDPEDAKNKRMIKRCRELFEKCPNSEVLIDFLFHDLTHEQIRDKYGFETSGAVKSRVFRMRNRVKEIIKRELESEAILERQIPSGVVTRYYENGELDTIKSESFFENYQMIKRIEYFESGKVKRTSNYVDGSLCGEYTEYYENGKVYKSGSYTNGKKSGEWTTYHENGKKDEWISYLSDTEKIFEVYNEQGKLEQYGHIVEGVAVEFFIDNVHTERYMSGKLKVRGNTDKKNNPIGIWEMYDEEGHVIKSKKHGKNGNVVELSEYDYASMERKTHEYNNDGELLRSRTYRIESSEGNTNEDRK